MEVKKTIVRKSRQVIKICNSPLFYGGLCRFRGIESLGWKCKHHTNAPAVPAIAAPAVAAPAVPILPVITTPVVIPAADQPEVIPPDVVLDITDDLTSQVTLIGFPFISRSYNDFRNSIIEEVTRRVLEAQKSGQTALAPGPQPTMAPTGLQPTLPVQQLAAPQPVAKSAPPPQVPPVNTQCLHPNFSYRQPMTMKLMYPLIVEKGLSDLDFKMADSSDFNSVVHRRFTIELLIKLPIDKLDQHCFHQFAARILTHNENYLLKRIRAGEIDAINFLQRILIKLRTLCKSPTPYIEELQDKLRTSPHTLVVHP